MKEDGDDFIKVARDSNLIKFITSRIDIKNFGSEQNSVEIIEKTDEKAIIQYPPWFFDSKGQGLVMQSFKGEMHLKIKCVGDGETSIILRSPDLRDRDGKRIPVYIDYIEFKVNGKDILKDNVVFWHDHPYEFKKRNKDKEIIDIFIKWMPLNSLSKFTDK